MKELLTQFDKMTLALAKDGNQIKQELTPEQANLLIKIGTPYVKS